MMNYKTFTHVPQDWHLEDMTANTTDMGRMYESPLGNLPSVTTVTGWEKSKFFAKWRRDNPQEARRTSVRGNHLHAMIEDYLNNELDKTKYDDLTQELFIQLKPELDKIDNIYALEVPLWCEATMLAGRVDCIAEYNGKLSVIDFKGATRPKNKKDIGNYFQQATAYAIAWQERTEIPISNFAILISTEEGITQVFEGNPIAHVPSLLKTIEDYHQHLLVENQ